jgi:two-component system response regulator
MGARLFIFHYPNSPRQPRWEATQRIKPMNETRTILLVDDSSNDAALTLSALKQIRMPHQVTIASDGAEALDFLFSRGAFQARPAGNPVMVLLDLNMPRVDGFEVLRQMRADTRVNLVPVVVFSSSREERDLLKSYELGANAFVVKPIEYQQLLQALEVIGSFWAVWNEAPPKRLGATTEINEPARVAA